MMDVHGLFATAKFGKTLAGYLGLFETLDIKIDKLAASELEAGIRALEQASNSERETESLLREARSRFNKAISLEKDEKLAMAYFGLGLCHYYLGDIKNCSASFESIGVDAEETVQSAEVKARMIHGLVSVSPLGLIIPGAGMLSGIYLHHKIEKIRKIKEKIDSCKECANQVRNDFGINNIVSLC